MPVSYGPRAAPESSDLIGIWGTLLAAMKSSCCKRFKKKGRPCKKCPTVAALSKKQLKRLLEKAKKKA